MGVACRLEEAVGKGQRVLRGANGVLTYYLKSNFYNLELWDSC